MNIEKLNTLPEVENQYKVELEDNEKVVFTAKLDMFGTEKDRHLGSESPFTLTNKRVIVDNGAGIWTIDILEDVIDCTKVESKFLWKKMVYFAVNLNKEVTFGNPQEKLNGYHFYFNKEDTTRFEEIINK